MYCSRADELSWEECTTIIIIIIILVRMGLGPWITIFQVWCPTNFCCSTLIFVRKGGPDWPVWKRNVWVLPNWESCWWLNRLSLKSRVSGQEAPLSLAELICCINLQTGRPGLPVLINGKCNMRHCWWWW